MAVSLGVDPSRLLAGNGLVLKHAGSVSGCALRLEAIGRATRAIRIVGCGIVALAATGAVGLGELGPLGGRLPSRSKCSGEA